MVQYVSDLLALGAFGGAAWQILGGWYKFRASRNKRVVQLGPFEAVNKALKAAATKGERATPEWGSGPSTSGNGHVVAGWNTLSAEARASLVEDLIQIAVLTGQLQNIKAIREGRTRWSSLTGQEQAQVVAALDGLRLDTLGAALKEAAPGLSKAWLWQVTEPVPLLAEEVVLSEPCSAELALLVKACDKAEKAVKEVLASERARHLAAVSSALGPLDLGPASTQLKELKGLLAGSLASQLGPAGEASATSQLRTTLAALADTESDDGGLVPVGPSERAAFREAVKRMAKEVADRVVAARDESAASAATAARAAEVSSLVQAVTSPVYWQPPAAAATQLALVQLVLSELVGAAVSKEPASVTKPLVDAAQKLVPKLPLTEEGSQQEATITQLLAALSPASAPASTPAAPAEEGTAEQQEQQEGDSSPAAPPSPQEAASQLASLLAGAVNVPKPPPAKEGDAGVVEAVVAGIFTRLLAAEGAAPSAESAASPAAAAELAQTIKSSAAAKADAIRKAAADKFEGELEGLTTRTTTSLVTEQVQAAGQEGADTPSAQRLALAAAYIKAVVLAGPDSSLVTSSRTALDLLRPDEEGGLLSAGATAALVAAQQLSTQVVLAHELGSGLELGAGLVALLDRLEAYCSQAAAETEAATKKKSEEEAPQANGHATDNGAENGDEVEQEDGPAAAAAAASQEEVAKPGPSADEWRAAAKLAGALAGDGLVLLELSAAESRKLSNLRAAVDGCTATTDDLVFNRHLTALKELSGQLGPIMGALETKSASASGSRQQSLQTLKAGAVSTYKALQAVLGLEHGRESTRGSALDGLTEVHNTIYSVKLSRSSSVLEAALSSLEGVKGRAEGVMGSIAALPGSEDAVSEIMVMEEQVDRLVGVVRLWSDWVRLREMALGNSNPGGVVPEEDAEIGLPPVSELQEMHAADATFVDVSWPGSAEGEDEGEEEEEEEEDKVAAASILTQGGGEEEEEAAQRKAIIEQLALWQAAGEKLVARGQVAVVLVAGATESNGELRCTRDVGLPSTKSSLQLFAERLLKSQQLAARAVMGPAAGIMRPLDWYIVCPQGVQAALRQFLEGSAYFGLQPSQVHFVDGEVARPALTADLKIAMEGPGRMAHSAPCTGDVFVALRQSGALRALRARGARYVEVHTLEDNLQDRAADPVFLGAMHEGGLDAVAKASDPAQLMHMYEAYAPLISTKKTADALGRLVPTLGSYCFSAAWLKQLEAVLDSNPLALYHLSPAAPPRPAAATGAAAKAAAAVQQNQAVAYRMERRLADWVTYPMPGGELKPGVVFVNPDDEFAPVVGAPPLYIPPTPTEAVDRMLLQHTNWVESAGGALADPEEGVVEVSPLVSYGGEGLEPLVSGRVFEEAYDLDLQGYAPTPEQRVALPHLALTAPLALAWLGLAALKVATRQQQ